MTMKDFLNSPLGKKLGILAVAALAAALSRYVPGWEKFLDIAAAFTAGGVVVKSDGLLSKKDGDA